MSVARLMLFVFVLFPLPFSLMQLAMDFSTIAITLSLKKRAILMIALTWLLFVLGVSNIYYFTNDMSLWKTIGIVILAYMMGRASHDVYLPLVMLFFPSLRIEDQDEEIDS